MILFISVLAVFVCGDMVRMTVEVWRGPARGLAVPMAIMTAAEIALFIYLIEVSA